MRHILAKEKHAFRLFLCVDNRCYLIMRNIGNASLNRLDFVGKSLLVFVRQLLTVNSLLFSGVRTILSNWACARPAHEQTQLNPFANVQLP